MKRLALSAAMFAFIAGTAGAIDIDAASGRFGVAIVNNGSGLGTVSPVVTTLGGSIAVSFVKGFFLNLQPSLDFYWTNYEWTGDRAVPTETERGEGNNAFVLGLIIDLPLTASVRFNERIGGAASIGPAFVLRAAFAADSTAQYATAMESNLASIASYLWAAGRWFYPSAALRFDVYLQNNFTFAFGAKGYLPLFNAWTGNANFWDEGILQITMAMLVGLQ
jgi:hypothetical protein